MNVDCRLDKTDGAQVALDESSYDNHYEYGSTTLSLLARVTSDGNDTASLVCTDSDVGNVYWNTAKLMGLKVG